MTRPPFDLVEAEEELVGRLQAEYSAIGFACFYLAEFANARHQLGHHRDPVFGGPDGPRDRRSQHRAVWFCIKVLIFLFIYVWFRATLPRLRYDQLMDLGWKTAHPRSALACC